MLPAVGGRWLLPRFLGTLALPAVALVSGGAHGDEVDPTSARTSDALLAGAAIELVPFAVGGIMVSRSGNEVVRRASVYVTSAGFTAAPLVAHGIQDEWTRGAVFASVPFACGAGLAVLMQQPSGDVLQEEGTKPTRITFWVLASTAFVASAAGVVDAILAPRRVRSHGLYVAPVRVASGAILTIGGVF
jgi:hypothetical protein